MKQEKISRRHTFSAPGFANNTVGRISAWVFGVQGGGVFQQSRRGCCQADSAHRRPMLIVADGVFGILVYS
jgi:hypothetical protein